MAKNIEVTLRLNDRQFTRGIAKAQARLKGLNRTAGSSTTAFRSFGAAASGALVPITAGLGAAVIAAKKFGTSINNSGQQIVQVGEAAKDTSKAFNRFFTEIDTGRPMVGDLGGGLRSVGVALVGGAGSMFKGLIKVVGKMALFIVKAVAMVGVIAGMVAIFASLKSALTVAAQFEDIQITMQNLTGSAEAGAYALELITEEATKLPFAFSQIAAATPVLATISKDLGELRRNINLAGDISANFGIPFEQAASSLQRAFSAGSGAADVFREKGVLAAAGFEAGVTYSIAQTQEKLLEFGASIEGAAQTLNTSFSGATSQAGDALTLFNKEVGDATSPFFKSFLLELVNAFRMNRDSVDEFAQQMGTNLVNGFQAVAIGGAYVIDVLVAMFGLFKSIVTIGGRLDGFYESVGEALKKVGLDLHNTMDGFIEFNKTDAVKSFFADVRVGAEEIKVATDLVKEGAADIDDSFKILIGNSDSTSDSLTDVKDAVQLFREQLSLSTGTLAEYNAFVKQLDELFKTGKIGITEYRDLLATLDNEFAQNEGLNNFLDTLGTAQKALSEDLVQAFRSGESASGSFKKMFNTLINQIIADVIRLSIIQPILGALMAPFGFGFGSGGSVIKLPGKATGGPVSAGGSYLVGERGPEILNMGSQGGHITPNNQLGGTTNVYNISAVDTQSFKMALAKDPEFIYNLTRAGSRRVPG